MNSKDKNGKPPAKKILPLMTPRNLVPATPMRFSGSAEETRTTTVSDRVIKGPSGKDKSSVPLPPGYVDRAAQRRSGLETANIFEEFETERGVNMPNSNDPMKKKLEFLEETKGVEGFPTCSQIQTERLMKFLLCGSSESEIITKQSLFKENEAFLQFKSIGESKTQPFDPFHRPKRVFRASGTREKATNDEKEDDLVLERVKEAVKRLEITSQRHEKYLETLAKNAAVVGDDIFPEVGVFDERAALENVIKKSSEKTFLSESTGKAKAKNRLFASKTAPRTEKIEKEVDVFELIAQKSLDDPIESKSAADDGGGLFGFSSILPKLSRLENETGKGDETKLTGAYASILSDEEKETDEVGKMSKIKTEEDADDYLYPGYLENDPIAFDSDAEEDDKANEKMPRNKRKLARKEDKEAAKVEKLVKSKFGVDLSK